MKLFWCPRTRAVRILWLLEETGLPYQRVLVNLRDPESRNNPQFRAASPMGKVPALVDGDVAMAESAAIALYIADRYQPGTLAPLPDAVARGQFLYWMFFSPGVIEPAMAEKFNGWKANRGQHGWGDFASMIETLERGLQPGPWLLEETFTVADILVGSSVVFMRMFGILPESAVLNEYADRCLARPAYQQALQTDADNALGD